MQSESLTVSPPVGIAQSFDGCALRSRKSVPIAAKVRAHKNGDENESVHLGSAT